ncbi:hypothetical protein WJM97_11915 [Okeanomitos corallinicola TIOX110]|uniref:Uncharacterized protein n=1 Tax=Okeanomitos corallinicola TIOX110 TaxID=3133117 RepID=A0ABZ2UL64_9CYAN
MRKSALATMMIVISTIVINTVTITKVYSQTKSVQGATNKGSPATNLVTEAASINNKWNYVKEDSETKNTSFTIRDPECKKINPLDYLDNPEKFFKPCVSTKDLDPKNYEPIEYLKVPRLDSGLSVTVTNF